MTEIAAALAPFIAWLVELLVAAPVVHFDETGARVNGERRWTHVAATLTLTYLFVHAKRGKDATEAMGVLGRFKGVAVHDGWKTYWRYACEHAQCLAHHIRTLRGIADVSVQEPWALSMIALLFEMRSAVADAFAAEQTALDPIRLHSLRIRYGLVLRKGRETNPDPPPGRKRNKLEADAYNELVRLDRDRDEILRFLTDFRVPFSNNEAERSVRMIKLQDKISGGWRSDDGSQRWATTRSYIQTARKHGMNILEVLTLAINGDPWLPPSPATT